ncbi:uncharacterized protein LOC144329153 [Podarcis muralis]
MSDAVPIKNMCCAFPDEQYYPVNIYPEVSPTEFNGTCCRILGGKGREEQPQYQLATMALLCWNPVDHKQQEVDVPKVSDKHIPWSFLKPRAIMKQDNFEWKSVLY